MGKLQANFWVNNFISLLGVVRSGDKAQKQLICEGCDSGDTVVSRCAECSVFMCDFCVKAHKRMHNFKHHQIVSLEEVKSGGPKALVKPMLCEKHRGETLKLFCQSCDKPICRDCTIVDHKTHEYLFVADAAAKEKKSVKQLLDKTKVKVPILSIGVKAVEEMEKRVKAKETAVNKDIDAFIDKNVRILEEKRASLKYEANTISQAKMKQLEAQREGLMIALASVSNSVEFTERALKDGSDVEVLSMKQQLVTNLSKLSSSTWKCKPCQEDTLQLRVDQDLGQVAGNMASVKDMRVAPEKCTVSMVGGEPGVMYSTLAGQRREFTVVLRDQHGNQINGEDDVEVDVSVTPINSPVRETIEVIHEREGFYSFNFQPQEQGIYEVAVAASGKHVAGSPYQWPVVSLGERCYKPTPRIMSHLAALSNKDVLSWKVKSHLGRERSAQLGVSMRERRLWVISSSSGNRFTPENPLGEVSNIKSWQDGDVFVLFLNMNTKKLIIRNLRTSETELFEGIQGPVSPYFYPDSSSTFSLDFNEQGSG